MERQEDLTVFNTFVPMGKRKLPDTPSQIAWHRFRSNSLAVAGACCIVFFVFVALLSPFIRPDTTPNSNRQNLLISKQKPGFSVSSLLVPRAKAVQKSSLWSEWIHDGKPSTMRELALSSYHIEGNEVVLLPFSPYPLPEDQIIEEWIGFNEILGENWAFQYSAAEAKALIEQEYIKEQTYWLGTDKYGRDLLSRLISGSRISIAVGFVAVLISLLVGLVLGALAGYYGGWIDELITWFINVVWSIPTLLMVIAITLAFGKGFWQVFIAVGLTMWVEVARVVRGQFISLRQKEFVEASRALGFGSGRIIFGHILPNALGPVIVIAAANFAAAILIEAGLSFLGIGAQIPTPSWGNMIKEHYALITTDLAYLAILPGLLIMLLVLAFMMVGNGLRDALDVRAA